MEASFNKLKLIQASKRRFHLSNIKVFGSGLEPWLSVKPVYAIHCCTLLDQSTDLLIGKFVSMYILL